MKVTKAWMCTKKYSNGMTTKNCVCTSCYPVVILQRSSYRRLLAVVKAAKKMAFNDQPLNMQKALAKLEEGK